MSLLLTLASDSGFNPKSIPGLQLWLKADSLSLNDNDAIGTWNDSSGNSNNATQAVAGSKPTYKTNIINSLPVARCDGGDTMTLTSSISLSSAYTLYALGKRATSQVWTPVANGTATTVLMVSNDNNAYVIDDAGGSGSLAYTGAAGNIVTRWHRSAVGSTNKFAATGMSEANVGITGAITISEMLARSVTTHFTTGDFAEILLWNVELTAPQMTQVETYLSAKWGVAL